MSDINNIVRKFLAEAELLPLEADWIECDKQLRNPLRKTFAKSVDDAYRNALIIGLSPSSVAPGERWHVACNELAKFHEKGSGTCSNWTNRKHEIEWHNFTTYIAIEGLTPRFPERDDAYFLAKCSVLHWIIDRSGARLFPIIAKQRNGLDQTLRGFVEWAEFHATGDSFNEHIHSALVHLRGSCPFSENRRCVEVWDSVTVPAWIPRNSRMMSRQDESTTIV